MEDVVRMEALLKKLAEEAPSAVSSERKKMMEPIITYGKQQLNEKKAIRLNFICTHNSRRSHLAQVRGQVAADFYSILARTYSAGIEVTAFHPNAVESFRSLGFEISKGQGENPEYELKFGNTVCKCFSKIFDDQSLPQNDFAAIMVCDHADENCPYIPGADQRIPLRYIDPKRSDGTEHQKKVYRETSLEIAREMFYLFSQLK